VYGFLEEKKRVYIYVVLKFLSGRINGLIFLLYILFFEANSL